MSWKRCSLAGVRSRGHAVPSHEGVELLVAVDPAEPDGTGRTGRIGVPTTTSNLAPTSTPIVQPRPVSAMGLVS